MFLEEVEKNGKKIARFSLIKDNNIIEKLIAQKRKMYE